MKIPPLGGVFASMLMYGRPVVISARADPTGAAPVGVVLRALIVPVVTDGAGTKMANWSVARATGDDPAARRFTQPSELTGDRRL